jgi:mercuric ion binding protein
MKITKTIVTLALVGLLSVSCKKAADTTEAKAEKATETPKKEVVIAAENVQTASFEIEGMTCAIGCAKTIEEELGALEGVQKATVDFDSKKATVVFDKTIQNQDNLTKVVEATADGKTYKVVLPKS